MNKTTNNSMNLHLHKGGRTASFQMPREMEEVINEVIKRKNIKFSGYVKLALNNQLERDIHEIQNNN